MGVNGSKGFVRNDKIEGQGKSMLLFEKKINLQKYELDRLFLEFCKLQEPTVPNLVETSRILTANKLPYCLMSSVLLQIFDRNKQGLLNFQEYVTVLWCFLTTNEAEMARYCFSLFDIRK